LREAALEALDEHPPLLDVHIGAAKSPTSDARNP
jgi:hypothetical protein